MSEGHYEQSPNMPHVQVTNNYQLKPIRNP